MPKSAARRIYALDTNVLLHDPTALFRFEEHDVFIPMTVLEELDEKKQGVSEVARNARQASRFLNELIERNNSHGIADGVPLQQPDGVKLRSGGANGCLYFQT
ncbi:MAG TPA: PIN domain-containing protein, partial [Rhodanobacteraceae bacterium]|nr:PIN domain-containing protein [Rhodanobacteraceae bacterium]